MSDTITTFYTVSLVTAGGYGGQVVWEQRRCCPPAAKVSGSVCFVMTHREHETSIKTHFGLYWFEFLRILPSQAGAASLAQRRRLASPTSWQLCRVSAASTLEVWPGATQQTLFHSFSAKWSIHLHRRATDQQLVNQKSEPTHQDTFLKNAHISYLMSKLTAVKPANIDSVRFHLLVWCRNTMSSCFCLLNRV